MDFMRTNQINKEVCVGFYIFQNMSSNKYVPQKYQFGIGKVEIQEGHNFGDAKVREMTKTAGISLRNKHANSGKTEKNLHIDLETKIDQYLFIFFVTHQFSCLTLSLDVSDIESSSVFAFLLCGVQFTNS